MKKVIFGFTGALIVVFALSLFFRPAPQLNVIPKPKPPLAVSSVPKTEAATGLARPTIQASAPGLPARAQAMPREMAKDNQPLPSSKAIKKQSGSPRVKEPIQDVEARLALTWVGADPEAEQYWLSAINDPSLPAEERKDLIEDLNEDGLSDPKHPGEADLPLILNRLELIESLAPYAMDQVNYDAFQEAYQDLNDLLEGKPVN